MRIFGRRVDRLTLGAIGIIVVVALIAFAVNQQAQGRADVWHWTLALAR